MTSKTVPDKTQEQNTHQACRPCPEEKYSAEVDIAWCLAPSRSRICAKRVPSNFSGFGYIASSVWVAQDGIAICVPAGTGTPLQSVHGRNARRGSESRIREAVQQ